MSRIYRVGASKKEYVCSKCGKVIPVGSPYCYGKVFRRRTPVRRCFSCGLKPYELSTSSYTRSVAPIVEEWEQLYGIEDGVWESIANDLQEVLDEVRESFENIPYQLQDGDTGSLLQERIDQLESVISQLDFDMENMLSEALESLEAEEQIPIYAAQAGGTLKALFEDCESSREDSDAFVHWKEEAESVIAQYIDDVLSELSY